MFRVLGTPTESDWKGIDKFKHYESLLVPNHPKRPLCEQFNLNKIGELGIDLLDRMLVYDPAKRITAKSALQHPFFKEFN